MALLGNPFTDYVTKQINTRQKALGEGLGDGSDINRIQSLQAYNTSTPWMRLASAVKITKGDEAKPGKSVYKQILDSGLLLGIPENEWINTGLAKRFVLEGAPNSYEGDSKPEGVASPESNPFLSAYGWGYNSSGITHGQGYVPPPGVTSVDFEYKNDGALAFASIKIKAFSREQFAMIDILYMRPGYTCLLEFGHTSGIMNDLSTLSIDNSQTDPLKYLFGGDSKPPSYSTMAKKISKTKDTWNGNYEGFFGRITKFDWKFNSDGSYDITVKLTGLGDVISSLKVNIAKQFKAPVSIESDFIGKLEVDETEDAKEVSSFIISNAYASQLNFDLYSIFADKNQFKDSFNVFLVKTNENATSYPLPLKNIPINGQEESFIIPGGVVKIDINDYGGTIYSPTTFIKFGGFLSMLQKICNITDGGDNSFLQFEMVEDVSSDIKNDFTPIVNDTFIATYPGNFSSNPNKCLIKVSKMIGSKDIWPTGFKPKIIVDSIINDVLTNNYDTAPESTDPIQQLENPKLAYTLSEVYVNINYISTILSGLMGGDEAAEGALDVSILDLLNGVLSGINSSLGGLNTFRVIYNEDTSQVQIISENPILSSKKTPEKPFAIFNTYGFERGTVNQGSFITSFDLNSELTDQMATQISIGAQSNSNTIAGNATAFSSYNKGLIDTLFVDKTPSIVANTDGDNGDNGEVEVVDEIMDMWRESSGTGTMGEIYDDRQLDEDSYIQTLDSLNNNISPVIMGRLNNTKKAPSPFFLPFNMSLTMNGLGGMKIYDAFKITGKGLPLSYNPDVIKLLIKSLSHTVSLEGWKTRISTIAQPIFKIDTSEGNIKAEEGEYIRKSSNSDTVAGNDVAPPPGIKPPSDEKLRIKLYRIMDDGTQTLGIMQVLAEDEKTVIMTMATSELPWKGNRNGVSCIPADDYRVKSHVSPKHGKCFWLIGNAQGNYAYNRIYGNGFTRGSILIHSSPKAPGWLEGCIAPGIKFNDADNQKGRQKGTGKFYLDPSKSQSNQAVGLLINKLYAEGSFKMKIMNQGGGNSESLPKTFNAEVRKISKSVKLLPNPK